MTKNIKLIKVDEEDSGKRLDKFVASYSKKLSFIAIQKLLRIGKIKINNKKAIGSYKIAIGDESMFLSIIHPRYVKNNI